MKEFVEVAEGKRVPKLMTEQMYKHQKDEMVGDKKKGNGVQQYNKIFT